MTACLQVFLVASAWIWDNSICVAIAGAMSANQIRDGHSRTLADSKSNPNHNCRIQNSGG